MEMDYKLVENEGLFQEYLEMGKYFRPDLKNIFTAIIFAKSHISSHNNYYFHFSAAVWFHHNFRCCLSSGPLFCSAQ